MKPFFVLVFASICFFQSHGQAHTLLVVSESRGMFGSDVKDKGFELFSLELVKSKLSSQYRKIYHWYKTSGTPFSEMAKTILSERLDGESLDVFSFEHGPNSHFLHASDGSEFPAKFIRRFYSTACQNAGTLQAGNTVEDTSLNNNVEIFKDLERLKVEEFIIHANNNYSTFFALPYILNEITPGRSWIEAISAAYVKADQFIMSIKPFLDTVQGTAESETLVGSGALASYVLPNAGKLMASRLVFGGSKIIDGSVKPVGNIKILNQLPVQLPTKDIIQQLNILCPKVMETTECSSPAKPSLSSSIFGFFSNISKLFKNMNQSENSCLEGKIFQPLVDVFLKTEDGHSPQIKELCFSPSGKNTIELSWELGPTPRGELYARFNRQQDYLVNRDRWIISMKPEKSDFEKVLEEVLARNPNIDPRLFGSLQNKSPINQLHIWTKGKIRVSQGDGKTIMNVKGLALNVADNADLNSISWALKSIGLTSLEVTDDGKLSTDVQLIVPITVGASLQSKQVNSVKTLGIKLFGK